MKTLKFLSTAAFLLFSFCTAFAESQIDLKINMDHVYKAFKELQPYMFDSKAFRNPKNEEKISGLISDLSTKFTEAKSMKGSLVADPGFRKNLDLLDELLTDAHSRFISGSKGYARWRLRTAADYCVSCHTTYKASSQFFDSSDLPKGISKLERAEFLAASRRFDEARKLFIEAANSSRRSAETMSALRRWLLIATRVESSPEDALKDISTFRLSSLGSVDVEEIGSWKKSFERWAKEKPAKVDPLRRAENLMRQGLSMYDPIGGSTGTVEFLRATSILHDLLEKTQTLDSDKRSQALYLLGVAYSKMEVLFPGNLSGVYFKRCILESPGTKQAQKAFKHYRDQLLAGFTGSAGTDLPEDVEKELKMLHAKAYGK